MPFGPDSQVVDRRVPSCPWWAQALDLISLSSIVVALALMLRSGPRFTVGSLFISIQSPWRVLLWATAVTVLRHLLCRRPSVAARLRPYVAAMTGSRSVRAVVLPFLASRAAVLAVAYLAVIVVGYPAEPARPSFSNSQFLNLVTKWDGEWYYTIAVDGYRWNDRARSDGASPANVGRPEARLAFFPAYPMLMRGAGWIAGNTIAGGLIVSFMAFFWALTYVFRLARDEIGDADAAGAVLLLAFYPFSLFYGVIYTESLFLLAVAGGLYHFRRAEWLKASVWSVLAGLTRPNGFLLSLVLAAAAFERVWQARRTGTLAAHDWRRARIGALVVATPVIGTLIYSVFCWSLSGDPLMWMRLHQFWGRGEHTLVQLVADRVGKIADWGLAGYVTEMPIDLVNNCAAVFAVLAIWPVWRRLGPALGLFVAVNVIPPLLSGTTLSIARLTSTLFPLFIWLAIRVRGDRRASLIGAFALLQGFFAVLFFTWRRFY